MRYIDTAALYAKCNNWGNAIEKWKNKNLVKDFTEYFSDKCWYSEAPMAMSDFPIDHWRPKGNIVQYLSHNYNEHLAGIGYDWLINDYRNYRACSTYSNRRTGAGGKSCYFPLKDKSPYLTNGGIEVEDPLLLDPCKKGDPDKLIFILGDIVPIKSVNQVEIDQAEASISIYNLRDSKLTTARMKIWKGVVDSVANLEATDPILEKRHYDNYLNILKNYISRSEQYSAVAINCINSIASYKTKMQLNLQL